jgi:N-acetylneuraminate lyase
MVDFLRLGKPRMPNLRGLKFSHLDMVSLQQCLALDGGFEVLFGMDEALLAALVLGVRGAIGSSYNFAAPIYQRIIAAFNKGDLETARREQTKSVAMVKQLAAFGFFPAAKSLMARLGLDCGPVRPPLRPIDAEQLRRLNETLALD